jgi:hypothetical protein
MRSRSDAAKVRLELALNYEIAAGKGTRRRRMDRRHTVLLPRLIRATLTNASEFTEMQRTWSRLASPSASRAEWVEQMAAMSDARNRIVAAGGWTAGPWTLMAVLELSRAEVQNCRVLRWLLDPLARHGFGADLVSSLCNHLGLTISHPELARVSAEVTRQDTRADIVIEGLDGGQVLVIEAKIDAPEGARQAERIEALWPEAELLGFLTVGGTQLPRTATERDRWRAISWSWFATTVEHLLNERPASADPREHDAQRAAQDWVAGIRRNLT